MNNDAPVFCSECSLWIPYKFSEIHFKKCHIGGCLLNHPLAKEGYLVAQIRVIVPSSSVLQKGSVNVTPRDTKWINCDEPDIMERLNYSFAEKFVFINEVDLYHSGIEAFSSVVLQIHHSEALFIAVPYDAQEIGTLLLYSNALSCHFPALPETSFMTVQKINNIKLGRQVKLKTPIDEDQIMIKNCFMKDYMYDYNYGLPFILKSNDSVMLKGVDGYFYETGIKINLPSEDNISLSREELLPHKQPDSYDPSETLLNSALKNLHMSLPKDIEMGASFDESSNAEANFYTSTPKREEVSLSFIDNKPEKQDSKRKQKKKKKVSPKNNSLKNIEINTSDSLYYFLSKYSEVEVTVDKESQVECIEAKEDFKFYKNHIFYELKNIIDKKIKACHKNKVREAQRFWNGILISGYPGTGKTTLVREISKELNIPLIIISLLSLSKSSSPAYIDDCCNKARACSPAILLFDEIDTMCHETRGRGNNFLDKILKVIQKLKNPIPQAPVILIGTTSRPEVLSPRIRQAGRFDKDIIMNLPDPTTRSNILWQLMHEMDHSLNRHEVDTLGIKAFGYSPSDLQSALQNSWRHCVSRWEFEKTQIGIDVKLKLKLEDMKNGFDDVVPFFLRENYSAISQVQWSDIWGYDDIKTKLKKMVQSSLSSNSLRGILLYGPPGCSKTMIVRALATETQFSFFPVKCSDMLSKYVGETEKSLCRVFEKAILGSPSIIFMDELDSLCGERRGTGAESTVIPELLSLLQKCLKSGNILVVGATNRPQAVDEALLSPGCLELLLHVDLPNCYSRCEIWKGLLKDVPKSDINIFALCAKTEGFSCAEICALYQRATHSLLESLCKNEISEEEMNLTEELLLQYLSSAVPRTSQSLLVAIQAFMMSRKRK